MGYIFISYARIDGKNHAEQLEQDLQTHGYSTWRDSRGIDPAKDFTAEIERAIKAADIVLTCITPDTERDDSFVRREIQYALLVDKQRRKSGKNPLPVYVLMFADIIPPIHVVNHTWVEFWGNWDIGFAHLKQILNTPIEKYQTPALPTVAYDPLRQYVEELYQNAVNFLDHTVIRMIELITKETLNAVSVPSKPLSMIDLFFNAHGIRETQTGKHSSYMNFAEAFDAFDGRVLLLGEPGAGKSITLMAFARDIAAKRLSDSRTPLPLLGLISSWPSNPSMQFDDWLVLGMADEDAKAIKEIISQGKAILLLDGLDELPQRYEKSITDDFRQMALMSKADVITDDEPNKRTLIQFNPQKSFIELLPSNNQIVVTCRVKDYEVIGQKIALNGAVTLRPLDDKQMQMYLAEQPELWAAVQVDDKLKEMLTTPLLLSFFAFAYRDDLDGLERQQLVSFSNSPADLRDKIFNSYVHKRYEHEKRKYILRGTKIQFTENEIYKTLGRAATDSLAIMRDNTITFEDVETQLSKENVEPFIKLIKEMHLLIDGEDIILPLPVNSLEYVKGIRRSKRIPSFRFLHRFIFEHFVSSYSLNQLKSLDSKNRSNAINALGLINDARGINLIIEALNDPDYGIRLNAVDALGKFGDTKSIPYIVPLLNDPEEYIRYLAASSLLALGDEGFAVLLLALKHGNVLIREVVISVLGGSGQEKALKPLRKMLRDEEKMPFSINRICDHASLALRELGELGVRDAEKIANNWWKKETQELIAIMSDAPASECVSAIESIIDRGYRHKTIIPVLVKLLDDKRISDNGVKVCDKATLALENLETPEALIEVNNWRKKQEL